MNDKHDGFPEDSPETLEPQTVAEPQLPDAQADAGKQSNTAESSAADIPRDDGLTPEVDRTVPEPPRNNEVELSSEGMTDLYSVTPAEEKEESPSDESGGETGRVPETAASGVPYRCDAAPPPPAQPPVAPAGVIPPAPRKRMSGSLKVFFWILGTLSVGLILAFIVY